jgi:cytoskeletal protein CcmA (bactofilin family)
MFSKNEEKGDTIIAQGVRLEGEFQSEGRVVIEGEVVGNIKTSSDILVGENASINASIVAHNATIAGKVRGDIKVEEKAEIGPTAEILGDINAQVLAIEAGARLVGKCTIGEITNQKAKKEREEE